ncbi:O-antigen translocase [Pseudomonas paeninsulae]|uniref:O-antigen translocase n=1 Tax=Pseudomonas paeninsulae TaxID=3110772 RepID=UPI002D79B4F7|nr:O-antigen translocase [Pseudomonas sp. IT1137]
MGPIYSALLTTIAQFSKIAVGFVLLKLIAINLGPEGLGTLGHFMSAVTILSLLAGGGVMNGIIKYVAEYRVQPQRLKDFISAVISYSLFFSLVFLVVGVVFSGYIADFLLGTPDYYWLVVLLAVAQMGFAFTNTVTGVFNGLRDTKTFAKIQIVGSLLALPLAWFVVANYGIAGSAIAIVMVIFCCVFPAIFYFKKSSFFANLSFSAINKSDFKRLSSFTLMLMTSALAFPLVEIVVREFLIRNSGYAEAGIWQAALRLSGAYLSFFAVFLAYYFMPLISAEQDKRVIQYHVFRFMLLVMGVFIFGAVTLYVGRDFFIPLLLSKDFVVLESLIVYQLVGDFFKISAYVVGFVGVAKAATKLYVAAEIVQSVLFILFGIFFYQYYSDVKGVMIGYAFSCFSYFLICVVGFFVYLRR